MLKLWVRDDQTFPMLKLWAREDQSFFHAKVVG